MARQEIPIDEMVADDAASPEVSDDEVQVRLLGLLTHLANRKWSIAKVTGIAMLCGVIISLLLPVQYTATTSIMPPQQTQSTAAMLMSQLTGVNGSSLAAIASGGGLSLKSPNDIYIGILSSRPVIDAIIQKFDLLNVYGAKNMTEARKILAAKSVIKTEKSGFISITVTDRDKQRVAAIANAYPDELRRLTKELAVTEASRRRLYYEEQLKQSKDALVAAALAFQQVQQQKGLVQLDAQAKAMIERLAVLSAQVAAKQVEVEALRSYSTEQNPDVQLAEKELGSLEAEETRLEQSNHAPGIAGLGLENVPRAGLEYLHAEHELQYQQALYDMLMKQYDAARLDESKDAAVVQVVEPAIPPDLKSSPHRRQIVLLFMAIGFVGACLYLYLSGAVQRSPAVSQSLAEFKAALIRR